MTVVRMRRGTASSARLPGLLAGLWALNCAVPALALASESEAVEKAGEGGLLGPPVLYSIQWSLLLLLFATTIIFIVISLAPEMRKRAGAARAKIILGFSALQILLVFAILLVNFLGEEYHEPALPGYIRHVMLILTGILLSVSGLMGRRKRV